MEQSNWDIIRQFIQEENAANGTDFSLSENDGETLPAEAGENVDDSGLQETVEPMTKKRKKPALRVIEGGATAIEKAGVPDLSELPTPGGIGLLLMTILFVLFALTAAYPGAHVSRLGLMWKAFVGKAQLSNQARASTSKPVAVSGGAPGLGYGDYLIPNVY